jgi:hypothetical protein
MINNDVTLRFVDRMCYLPDESGGANANRVKIWLNLAGPNPVDERQEVEAALAQNLLVKVRRSSRTIQQRSMGKTTTV